MGPGLGTLLPKSGNSTQAALYLQALHGAAEDQVLVHDFLDIGLASVGVPDRLRVDHEDGALFATVQAPGGIDPDAPGPRQASHPDALLGQGTRRFGLMVLAARPPVAAVSTEEDMAGVVAQNGYLLG